MNRSLQCPKVSATERNFRSRIAQLASGQWFLRGTHHAALGQETRTTHLYGGSGKIGDGVVLG